MRVLLKHRETSAKAEGILCPMKPEHLSSAQLSWSEAFSQRLQTGSRNEDSILWERGFMSPAHSADLCTSKGHVIVCEDRIEGILITSPAPLPSRLNAGQMLTYVRYLATAPWNRDGLIPEHGFLGIGRLLVGRAVLDSIARGHDGRIGLHSYTAATSFYESLGFYCHGADPVHRGMALFELPPRAVSMVLAELGARMLLTT